MTQRGVRLFYDFERADQGGAQIDHPLFDLLSALHDAGSIRHAAKALARSYRFVWGELKHWEEVLGQPLVDWVQGKRAVLTPFAQRLLWAERQARVRLTPHIEALRAELQHALAQAYDERNELLEITASHDLALPRLQALAAPQRLHLSLRFAGSADALRSLDDGRCTVAGFHVPRLPEGSPVFARALRPLLRPGEHKLIASHSREQGLMVRKGSKVPAGLADIAAWGWRFVNRQPGSGTRLLADHLLDQAHVQREAIGGYTTRIEHTHVAVAASIAAGAADVGIGVHAAAHDMGLAFVPLVVEDYFLVCLKPALESPAVRRLRDTLGTAGWPAVLHTLAGYGPPRQGSDGGDVLSLTRALPWWPRSTQRPGPSRRKTPGVL